MSLVLSCFIFKLFWGQFCFNSIWFALFASLLKLSGDSNGVWCTVRFPLDLKLNDNNYFSCSKDMSFAWFTCDGSIQSASPSSHKSWPRLCTQSSEQRTGLEFEKLKWMFLWKCVYELNVYLYLCVYAWMCISLWCACACWVHVGLWLFVLAVSVSICMYECIWCVFSCAWVGLCFPSCGWCVLILGTEIAVAYNIPDTENVGKANVFEWRQDARTDSISIYFASYNLGDTWRVVNIFRSIACKKIFRITCISFMRCFNFT